MDYIRQSIGIDEELIHVARFHWMYVVNAFFNLVFSVLLAIIVLVIAIKFEPIIFGTARAGDTLMGQIQNLHPGMKLMSMMLVVLGFMKFVHLMIIKATTEIGITDMRLVYKRGLIARAVGEINIDRVEGVNVLQGVMGRVFGYGRVMVRGMGVGEIILPPIAQPIRFKKAIEYARLKSRRKGNQPPLQD